MTGSTPAQAPAAAAAAAATTMGLQATSSTLAEAQAVTGILKLSPSVNMAPGFVGQLPLPVAGKTGVAGEPLQLTPYLSPFNLSPWMMVAGLTPPNYDVNGLSPSMAQQAGLAAATAVGSPQLYMHGAEQNKFQRSFSAALQRNSTTTSKDAEVPQIYRTASAHYLQPGAPQGNDRAVPRGKGTKAARVSKAKTTKKAAKKVANGCKGNKGKAKKATAGRSQKKRMLPEDLRREKRREQNRINAAKCRQRKVEKVDSLQAQLDALNAEHVMLQRKFAEVEAQLRATYR